VRDTTIPDGVLVIAVRASMAFGVYLTEAVQLAVGEGPARAFKLSMLFVDESARRISMS
jgi:hypothetical protein